MVAAPDGAVAVITPPTFADLAADPGGTGRLVPEQSSHNAVLPVGRSSAGPLRSDDTVPGSEGQVPLFGVRLPAG